MDMNTLIETVCRQTGWSRDGAWLLVNGIEIDADTLATIMSATLRYGKGKAAPDDAQYADEARHLHEEFHALPRWLPLGPQGSMQRVGNGGASRGYVTITDVHALLNLCCPAWHWTSTGPAVNDASVTAAAGDPAMASGADLPGESDDGLPASSPRGPDPPGTPQDGGPPDAA